MAVAGASEEQAAADGRPPTAGRIVASEEVAAAGGRQATASCAGASEAGDPEGVEDVGLSKGALQADRKIDRCVYLSLYDIYIYI